MVIVNVFWDSSSFFFLTEIGPKFHEMNNIFSLFLFYNTRLNRTTLISKDSYSRRVTVLLFVLRCKKCSTFGDVYFFFFLSSSMGGPPVYH